MLALFRYISDFFQYGCIVRRQGGRGGVVTYSEVWRNARFEYEIGTNGWGVYLSTCRRWQTLFGLPLCELSEADKQRILNRMQRFDKYEGW